MAVGRYEHGNYLSPCAKVVEINGREVEAWLYRGGNPKAYTLELISRQKLNELLNIQNGDDLNVVIMEVEEGTIDMPKSPPNTPGKTVERK